jgi:redox-sensitive bicupin YhaK (pirin superfamily)
LALAGATAGCSKQATPSPEPAATAAPEPARSLVLSVTALQTPWQTRDPFLFCVHHDDRYPRANDAMGPAVALDGRDLGQDFAGKDGWRMYHGRVVPGFPRHPHRGFETVTVVRRGLLDHSDSMGATARYGGGDVQWLTAGDGIQHAEMFPLLERDRDNPLELFQIWLNLPRANKRVAPHFSMLWNDTIPKDRVVDVDGRATEVTIVAGRHGRAVAPAPPPNSWAANPDNQVAIWAVTLEPGARFTLPAARPSVNRTLYVYGGGSIRVGGARDVPSGHLVDLRADAPAVLEGGLLRTEILLLQGKPIGEPIARQGPFVMNTGEEIRQAYVDYRRTK